MNFFVVFFMNSKIFLIIPSYGKKANTQKYIIKVNKKEQTNSIISSNLQGMPVPPPPATSPPTPPEAPATSFDKEEFIKIVVYFEYAIIYV
jgi:hypothetical protein